MAEIWTYRLKAEGMTPEVFWSVDEGWVPEDESTEFSDTEQASSTDSPIPSHAERDAGCHGLFVPPGEWVRYITQYFPVRATYTLDGVEYEETPVINPGSWSGNARVVVLTSGDHYVVEACGDDHIEELIDECDEAADQLVIPPERYADYDLQTPNSPGWDNATLLGNAGEPCDIEGVEVRLPGDLLYVGKPGDLF